MKIAIIDYSIGNVQSIFNALSLYDIEIVITSDKNTILDSDALILPGVGAYKRAMEELKKRDLPNTLSDFIKTGKPVLGICLGMQLLLETSQEFGASNGLGLVNGKVVKFSDKIKGKLPHVSWNSLLNASINWDDGLLDGISEEDDFYFVHSFICQPRDSKNILAYSNYGGENFCAVMQKGNIYGCQFHPEKSSKIGLKVLNNFIKISSK
tara:strand:+ start:44 stop:673 length:630 start_codon:yes stop_codon:yes gene_type:complete